MIGIPPPNRDRFLAAIADRVAPDRVQALYLFAPIRQGAVETGVAVIAAEPADGVPGIGHRASGVGDRVSASENPLPAPRSPLPDNPKPVVLTARYRHTLKGADRGKWEFEIHEQADAPLATVEKVMRGVQERLDESVEPERLDADVLRVALAEGVWTAPPR